MSSSVPCSVRSASKYRRISRSRPTLAYPMEGDWVLEIAIAAVLVGIALFTMSGRQTHAEAVVRQTPIATFEDGSDLPCPWCRAQTQEGDLHCPSCGHRFG